ncbi:MAG: hypothetical protein AB7P52_01200 [Alphaproteobacteria bacterium]
MGIDYGIRMHRARHRRFALALSGFLRRGGRRRPARIGITILAAAACLAAILVPHDELAAGEATRPAGSMTDAELARISVLPPVAEGEAPDAWADAADPAWPSHGASASGEENAAPGDDSEPVLMNDTAAAIVEAMTMDGDPGGPGPSVSISPTSLQLLDIDDGSWVSLSLTKSDGAFQTTQSP